MRGRIVSTLAALTLVQLPGIVSAPPAAAQAPSCLGEAATIVADPDASEVVGTPGKDVIVGSAEKDNIKGLSGNDIVCAGDGADTIDGGEGDDTIDPGRGNDRIDGGDGGERIGDAVIYTDAPGKVTFTAKIRRNHGNCPCIINAVAKVDLGGRGGKRETDKMASESVEIVVGSGFDDALGGGFCNCTLIGGGGDDLLISSEGNDNLVGSSGDDTFLGGDDDNGEGVGAGDEDSMFGEAGNDTVSYMKEKSSVTIDLQSGEVLKQDGFTDLLNSIENATGTDAKSKGDQLGDVIKGNSAANILIGGDGDDSLEGRAGNDELYGQEGSDVLFGDPGSDVLDGGPNPKTLGDLANFFFARSITASLALGTVSQDGFGGSDTITDVEDVQGSAASANNLDGDDGPNFLFGGFGADHVHGLGGDDDIVTSNGADRADGGDGDDNINARQGSADGGPGRDYCLAVTEVNCELNEPIER